MKKIIFLIISISAFAFSCSNINKKQAQSNIDKRAILLNDSALNIARLGDSIEVLKAITLLNEATKIQPDFVTAYWNKLVYQSQLGLKKESFETLKKIEELRPYDPVIKSMKGISYEINGDTLNARKEYIKADILYKSILDTLKSDPYQTMRTSYAMNIKLLGKEEFANKMLTSIADTLSNESFKEMVVGFINTNRNDLLRKFP